MSGLDLYKKPSFIHVLETLPLDELPISDYNKIYLRKHISSITYSVNLAWQILDLGIKKSNKSIEEITVLEIGGGTGIISLLAIYLGFNKVIYSDTFKPSCNDFEIISNALKLKPQAIICGSINEIEKLYKSKIDLIVSRDVVEHIYNPALFFETCVENFSGAVLVHNTSANLYNIFKKGYFKKLHEVDEWKGNTNQFKPGDSVESFYQMRLDYISKNYPHLSNSRKEILAAITRGMTYTDIKKAVENYQNTEILPPKPIHPTNTCDPANGNWSEHLLSLYEYELFVSKYDYSTEWYFAPYDEWRNTGLKKIGLKILNQMMRISGRLARYITPALIMVMKPQKNRFM